MDNDKINKNMWYNITEQLDVKTCLDLNNYIESEMIRARSELIKDYINNPQNVPLKIKQGVMSLTNK